LGKQCIEKKAEKSARDKKEELKTVGALRTGRGKKEARNAFSHVDCKEKKHNLWEQRKETQKGMN